MKALIFSSIFSLAIVAPLSSSTLHVPAEYATIQSAIDAANTGDVVQIEAGIYHELLSINKSITLNGADQEICIISDTSETFPIVNIHADSVTLSNLEVNGGYFNGDFHEAGPAPRGIQSQDTKLKLDHLQVRMIRNYQIDVHGGSCQISDVVLNPGDIFFQCDIGVNLIQCSANILRLTQMGGNIDHTINIDGVNSTPDIATITIDSCTIRASKLSWGDCIRSYGYSRLRVANCRLYREPGGEPKGVANHTGIGINGPYVVLTARNNVFDRVPWGIFIYGSITGSNVARIERNTFQNCEIGGLRLQQVNYNAVDLGGGAWGSAGLNSFYGSALYDVQLNESTEDVFALNNSWSQSDPDDGIYDKLDDAGLGRVIYQTLVLEPPHIVLPIDGDLRVPWPPVLSWSLVRGALFYFVQISREKDFKRNIEETTIFADTAFIPALPSPGEPYWWRVRAANYLTEGPWSDIFSFQANYPDNILSKEDDQKSRTLVLHPAYPNPFNSGVTLQYELPHAAAVMAQAFNLNGELVQELDKHDQESGLHALHWNAKGLPSGVYVLRISAGDYARTQKIILLR